LGCHLSLATIEIQVMATAQGFPSTSGCFFIADIWRLLKMVLANVPMRAIPDARTDAHPQDDYSVLRSCFERISLHGNFRPRLSAGFL